MCGVYLENGFRVVGYLSCIGSELTNQMFQLKHSVTNEFQQKEHISFCITANDQEPCHIGTAPWTNSQ